MGTADLEKLSKTLRFPAPARSETPVIGARRDVWNYMGHGGSQAAMGEIRAHGRYNGGGPAIPVTYVSKRAVRWYERRWVHVLAIVVGALLTLAAGITWAIMSLGLATFLALVLGIPTAGVVLASWLKSRGGGGGATVTTTTTVRLRR